MNLNIFLEKYLSSEGGISVISRSCIMTLPQELSGEINVPFEEISYLRGAKNQFAITQEAISSTGYFGFFSDV